MGKVLVNDTTLTGIADAIREKNGETVSYKPSEMAAAISAITTGGGDIDGIIDGTATVIANDTVTKIRSGAFYDHDGLTSVTFSAVEHIGTEAFYKCSKLKTVNFPAATSMGEDFSGSIFNYCYLLESAYLPSLLDVCLYAFYECKNLKTVDLSSAVNIGEYAFASCWAITKIDLPAAETIYNNAFYRCTALDALILRNTEKMVEITYGIINWLDCPIITGDTTGFVYVPSALLSTYQADQYWSAIANKFRAIEDYPEICG